MPSSRDRKHRQSRLSKPRKNQQADCTPETNTASPVARRRSVRHKSRQEAHVASQTEAAEHSPLSRNRRRSQRLINQQQQQLANRNGQERPSSSVATSRSSLRQTGRRLQPSSTLTTTTQDQASASHSNGAGSQLSVGEASNGSIPAVLSSNDPAPLVTNREETQNENLEQSIVNSSTQRRRVIVQRRSKRIAKKLEQLFQILQERMDNCFHRLADHLRDERSLKDEIIQDSLRQLLNVLAVLNHDYQAAGRQAKILCAEEQLEFVENNCNICHVCSIQQSFREFSLYPTTTIQQDAVNYVCICTICRSAYQSGDIVLEIPTCKHKFHVHCIKRWIREKKTCCPNCRTDVGDRFLIFCRIKSSPGPD